MASEPTCTYNNQVISTVDALWVLIQGQTKAVRKALTERLLADQEKAKTQRQMVKDSLTRAFDDLHSGKVHHDARKLFSMSLSVGQKHYVRSMHLLRVIMTPSLMNSKRILFLVSL